MTMQAPFPDEEYATRLRNVQQSMADKDLDALLVLSPENIYYLVGLDHQGFFAFHLLVVPREGEPCLITRAMESVVVNDQVVPRARWVGFADSDDPARFACDQIRQMGLGSARIAIEKDHIFITPRNAEGILSGLPRVEWVDAPGLVEFYRQIKSPREVAYTRQAANVADAMLRAAAATAAAGVNEKEVAAEVYRAMILAGGDYPGFVPFIRSTETMRQEHTTWRDRSLEKGEMLVLEMGGCIRRYHAPASRMVFIGVAPAGTEEMAEVCIRGLDAVVGAIRPGIKASQVYQAWQSIVDEAGLPHYHRHHCGYMVGIGFPPSWVGGGMVVGLRSDSEMELRAGMVFHVVSWLMGTGRPGDYFVTDAAVCTDNGCEVLTTATRTVQVV
jgi:Xaa-Pro dipeptidase